MADTTIRVFLGIATESDILGATVVEGDYRQSLAPANLPTSYVKVADLTGFPELIGDAEDIDSTTMSDTHRTSEAGIQSSSSDPFMSQFERSKFEAIQELVEKNGRNAKYRFCLLISSSKSVFDWVGSINVGLGAGEINDIISMPIPISRSTPVKIRKGYDGVFDDTTSKITVSARASAQTTQTA